MTNNDQAGEPSNTILRLTGDIVAAYVGKNPLAVSELPSIIRSVHGVLTGLSGGTALASSEGIKPAVTVKKSITPDYIICLEDGKKLKMLKRYLRSRYGLTPDAYRAKWGLPADYPMVAPNYAAKRSAFAKKIGLGRGAAPRKRGRRG